eukprot:gb/GECH01011618.1/.p1 GENE.gb/GECH01011618.1/~~gb/GECH01011618.1/.p1  ORF type:complete len:476 (+),score=73.55 gb/GECH01011618.1/:1-1428(+)
MTAKNSQKEFSPQYIEAFKFKPTDKKTDEKSILVIINGGVYDLTKWAEDHPGGKEILQHFSGYNATYAFRAFHLNKPYIDKYKVGVLSSPKTSSEFKTKKKEDEDESNSGKYESDPDPENKTTQEDKIANFMEKFEELHKEFTHDKKEEWFSLSYSWLASKLAVLLLLIMSFIGLTWLTTGWWSVIAKGVVVGSLWHQSGFIAHDAEHSGLLALHKDKRWHRWDRWLGFFSGNIVMGISGAWWKSSHNIHHGLTNLYHGENGQIIDEQQDQTPFWLQSQRLIRFHQNLLSQILLKFQKWTFLFGCLFIGRCAIVSLGVVNYCHNITEMIGIMIHFGWQIYSLTFMENWLQCIAFYTIATVIEGILHIQLELSHFNTEMISKEDCEQMPWPYFQLVVSRNIKCSPYMDWFHGGLQFQIEHHLWPRMPRHNLRAAAERFQKICKETGVVYQEETFFDAIWLVHDGLGKVADQCKINL